MRALTMKFSLAQNCNQFSKNQRIRLIPLNCCPGSDGRVIMKMLIAFFCSPFLGIRVFVPIVPSGALAVGVQLHLN